MLPIGGSKALHSALSNLLGWATQNGYSVVWNGHQIVYSTPGDAKRSELLVKRVHERKQAAEWRWLLEKAQELRHR